MLSTDYTWELIDGQTLTFDVSYTAEPYRPARVNGDPDDCHPAEGGISDIEVTLQQAEVVLFGATVTLIFASGFPLAGWSELAEAAEAAAMAQCEDELMAACEDAEEIAHETALADHDAALEARRDDE